MVTVNILDAQGIDMCLFRNPIAALYAQLFTLINLRSAEDRSDFYKTYVYFGVPSPSVLASFDKLGVFFVYLQTVNQDDSAVPYLQSLIAAINQYQNVGNQGVSVLQISSAITATVASFPSNINAYSSFLVQMGGTPLPPLEDPQLTTQFLYNYYVKSTIIADYEIGLKNLSKEKIIILSYLNTFGIVKNQASPLYVNAIQGGVCYWASNHFFGPYGIMYRIVLSQQDIKWSLLW